MLSPMETIALHNLCWYFLFSHWMKCTHYIILNHVFLNLLHVCHKQTNGAFPLPNTDIEPDTLQVDNPQLDTSPGKTPHLHHFIGC